MSSLRYPEYSADRVTELAAEFSKASPFRHIVVDDFVARPRAELLDAFPDASWDGWQRYGDAYQPSKMICNDIAKIPGPLAALIHELNSPAFLEFVEKVSGIKGLIPDPYLSGGGLHSSGPGGILTPHTDFHIYSRLRVFRQINVLLYLNDDWREEYGGCLELWREDDGQGPERVVVPEFGRCVMFKTDDHSIHGFSTPISHQDIWRKSIALYYYTSDDPEAGSANRTTHWKAHGELTGTKKARLRLSQGLLGASRGLTFLANRVNPNIGFRRVRAK
jgi:hypothetical protein